MKTAELVIMLLMLGVLNVSSERQRHRVKNVLIDKRNLWGRYFRTAQALLAAGILDNTLNLKSSITTERDREAYKELVQIRKLPNNWHREYFGACEAEMMKDFTTAIKNDIKIEKVGVLPEVIGQMVVLDMSHFDRQEMNKIFVQYPEWLMNVISLEDGKSYLYYSGKGVRERLENLLGARYQEDGLLVLDEFLLRK